MNLGFCLGFANNLNFCYLFVSDAEYNEELQQRPGLTRKGNFPACPQEVLGGRCPFHGAPAFLSTQGSSPALAGALSVLLPVLGKA